MRKKKWFRRAAGVLLAGVVAFSSAAPPGAAAVTVQAASKTASYVEIVGGSDHERSEHLNMTDNQAVVTLEVIVGGDFRTNIVDDGKYIGTNTYGEGWYAGEGASGNDIVYACGDAGTGTVQGHIYEVRYTKDGADYTIEYYDISLKKTLCRYTAKNTTLRTGVPYVYATAESGTYHVYNSTASDAGFSEGAFSSNINQYNHGVNRSRRVSASDVKNDVPSAPEYDVNADTQGQAKDGEYNKYFLKDSLQEVKINIDEDNLDYVLQNSATKEYALAKAVTIADKTVQYVGLKTKGNFTRAGTEASTSDRFSFTINFGKYVKKKKGYTDTQNFFGCKKISFNNFYFDKTMMKEYNALRLMTEMGIPTPQYGLAKLYINNQYYGVYFMIEAIDESILEQYYNASSGLSTFLTKPSYYSPRYYSPDLDDSVNNGEITWDALVSHGHIIEQPDGSYGWDHNLGYYSGLWENDFDNFQDLVTDLPAALTWVYRLTMLSDGKDFQGRDIEGGVNSDRYKELLNEVMDVDETLRYFAAQSFVVQMDNLFTWRQNYALYVDKAGKSVIVPWDYDLAWGYGENPADGEAVANWDIDKLYNDVASEAHYYTEDKAEYYAGTAPYYESTGYPLFNVIYQNTELRNKFRTYMEDCAKMAALGGTTSTGNYYDAGRYGDTIDALSAEILEAAGEKLAGNVYYLNGYQQPRDAEKGLKALKKILALRSVGVWLQVNQIEAKVTGYGYPTGSLGGDKDAAEYTTSGNNIAVVDDTTGIFTVADYAPANDGPELSAEIIKSGDEYTAVENQLKAESAYAGSSMIFTLYKLAGTGEAASDYDVYLPAPSGNAAVYSYAGGALTKLDATDYDGCTKKVTVADPTYLVVADKVYQAKFTKGEGVESIDVYYTQDYQTVGEKDASGAIARADKTGMNDVTGDGQINFKVNVKDGYKIKSVTVDNSNNYKNVKGPDETEAARVYRITKISGDITVHIETESVSQYNAVFEKDAGVTSIDLYHRTVRNEADAAVADESDVESGVVRNGDTGEIDISGDGQINFKVHASDGMIVKKITVTGGSYSNIKGKDETGVENLYRVTKIIDDVKIKIETESKAQNEASAYKAAFNKDAGVSSIDVFYTQNYNVPSETDVSSALVRDDVTGACDSSGDGQVNFRVNVKDGYKIKSVTVDNKQNYKNLKKPDETKAENVYRVTKVTGNIAVTVETEEIGSTGGDDPVPEDAETLTGTEWWTGMQAGKDYKLVGDGTVKLKVKAESGNADGYAAFNAELVGKNAAGNDCFLTTGSNTDAWAVEQMLGGNAPVGNIEKSPDVPDSNQCAVGHTYLITVTRAGNKFTVDYYDTTAGKNYFHVVWTWEESKLAETVNLHILAQVGKFRVWKVDEVTDPGGDQSGDTPGGSTGGNQPGDTPGGSTGGNQPGNTPGGSTGGNQPGNTPGGSTGGSQTGSSSAASIKLSKKSVKIYTGKASNKIKVKATLKGVKGTVSWKSSDKKVATVNKTGNTVTIKAAGAGTAKITATCGKAKATVRVVVKNPTITVKKGSKSVGSSLSLKKKQSVKLTVATSPKKSGVCLSKLSRKDKKIVTVSLKGSKLTIKGKKKGSVVVSIKSGRKTKKIKVKVK